MKIHRSDGPFIFKSVVLVGLGFTMLHVHPQTAKTQVHESQITHSQNETFVQNTFNVLFKCQENDCLPSQAFMLRALPHNKDKNFEACSSVLISETTLLTNAHCIDPNQCSSTVFYLPEIKNPQKQITYQQEALKCKKVLYRTDRSQNPTLEDIAIVEIEKPSFERPILKMNFNGVSENESLELVSSEAERVGDQIVVRSQKTTCKASNSHLGSPAKHGKQNQVLALFGCDPKPGHSGSPLINSQKQITAVLHSNLKPEALDLLKNLSDSPDFKPFAIATNLTKDLRNNLFKR